MKNITEVGVVGSGTMGSAIAQHFCMKNLKVVLVDMNEENLNRGRGLINDSFSEAVKRKIMSEDDKNRLLGNIHFTTGYGDLKQCEFVVEAVFEDFNVKKAVFQKIEENVPGDCIIATNTSSFPIADLANDLKKKGRFLGVHYFYHAAKNNLIEIIPGKDTSDDFVRSLNNFYFYYDKLPIIVRDVPGFAVNRFFVPWLNEAVRLYEEGLGSMAAIDAIACDAFRVGMGPFALMNATGVPIAMHAAQTLADAFGPFYAPAALLKEQVKAGKPWDIRDTGGKTDEKAVRERLLGATLGVAAQMVSEGVTNPTNADLGARIGLRWPVGPFEMMNEAGIEEISGIIGQMFKKWDMKLPEIFAGADRKKGFMCDSVASHIVKSVGIVEFNRPDSMNALNETVMEQLSECFDTLEKNPSVEKIVFIGKGKAFIAGADIKFFIDNIDAGNIDRIYTFTDFGQKLLSRIAGSKKATIAYMDGHALGGGLEFALACRYRIGTKRTMLAFPETGIGIYPGLGGTQRTTRIVGKGLAKYLVATGSMINADKALKMGLIDSIAERLACLDDFVNLSIPQKKENFETSPEDEFATFDGSLSDKLFEKEIFKKNEKSLRSKAPLALKKAMELIDEGEKLGIDDALQLELKSLNWIFKTKDARVGLGSIIKRERPVYKGE
jgi:enoyl-CoA hydratase/3-hydroxyacyl-CoA dehydrogenase